MKQITYLPIPDYDRNTALDEIASGVPERIVNALLALAFSDTDWRWTQDLCMSFVDSPDDNIRGIAILCLSYVARFRRMLDTETAIPIAIAALDDPSDYVRGNADYALEDILMCCISENYDRA